MRRGPRIAAILALLSLVVLVAATVVRAEHELDHRYIITGRVTDIRGQPVCSAIVRASDISAPSLDSNRTSATDSNGNYRIQLHLHSAEVAAETSNEGDTLLVVVEGHGSSRTLLATKNPNADAWGNSVVNIQIPHTVDTECQSPILAAALYVGLPILVIGGAIMIFLRWKPRRAPRRDAVESLPGVGHGKTARLKGAGFGTIEKVAHASPKALATSTGLSLSEAKRLIRKAKDRYEQEGGDARPRETR